MEPWDTWLLLRLQILVTCWGFLEPQWLMTSLSPPVVILWGLEKALGKMEKWSQERQTDEGIESQK